MMLQGCVTTANYVNRLYYIMELVSSRLTYDNGQGCISCYVQKILPILSLKVVSLLLEN